MTTSKKDYTKNIIEEYNIRLQSWGNSDSWGLTEFKMLEDLIYEAQNMRINANTLKRFFQQKTSNPQVQLTMLYVCFSAMQVMQNLLSKRHRHPLMTIQALPKKRRA